jgi:hypothetical protein
LGQLGKPGSKNYKTTEIFGGLHAGWPTQATGTVPSSGEPICGNKILQKGWVIWLTHPNDVLWPFLPFPSMGLADNDHGEK